MKRLKMFYEFSRFNPFKWLWCFWCEIKFQVSKKQKNTPIYDFENQVFTKKYLMKKQSVYLFEVNGIYTIGIPRRLINIMKKTDGLYYEIRVIGIGRREEFMNKLNIKEWADLKY